MQSRLPGNPRILDRGPNLRQTAGNFTPDMESDPFGFIIDSCHISSSQEEILRTCPFVGEPERLSEDESQDPAGAAVESTELLMVSPPESTELARNDNVTPQETYHTPPEESAAPSSASGEETILHWGCKDSERAVDLGRDSDPGLSERTERAVSQRHGQDPLFKGEKAWSLKRGPGSHETHSKKPRLSETNEGSGWFPGEGSKILEINLRLETSDVYAGIIKEKIKENLEKAVESLKDYGSTFQREIEIREGTSTKKKLNLSVEINGAPRIADLREESESVPGPRNSLDRGNNGSGLKAQACDDQLGQRSTEINISVANVQRFKCDSGPKEADEENGRSVTNAAAIGTVAAQINCARGVEGVKNIDKFQENSGKDAYMGNKGKAVAESVEPGIRWGENPKAGASDDHEGQRSSGINIQKDKDGLQCKEADRDNVRSVSDVEVIGVTRRDHRGEVENIENAEKFRHSRRKNPCSPHNGKAIAGQKEIHVNGGERPSVQVCDGHEVQKSGEANYGVESIQNMGVNTSNGRSSNVGGLRILPSCVHVSAQHVRGRVISKAPSRSPNLKKIDILDVLKQVAETCEGPGLEKGSILDIAKKRGITFPHLKSRLQEGFRPGTED